ncbi:MAG: AMP-binding protein, partial [Candidatus Riflemargulisbacteria bacterium]
LNLAYHEIPKTLPFSEDFVRYYQTDFLNSYFLDRERLLKILPKQMNLLSEKDTVLQYSLYLPKEFSSFKELIEFFGIEEKEFDRIEFQKDNLEIWDNLNKNIASYFPKKETSLNAIKVLLIDVSQEFSKDSFRHHNVIEPPLGLMYILTYLDQHLGSRIDGKIIKSRIDFDSYSELEALLNEFGPDVIGMRALSHNNILFHHIAAVIRDVGFSGPLICGGPYPTSSYEELLVDGNVDIVVIGEGEETFVQLIQEVINNNNKLPSYEVLKNISGIAFRMKGKERRNPHTLIIEKQFRADSLVDINVSDKELAYIIFTSGSTGEPKGVMIERKSVNNLLEAWDEFYGLIDKPKNVLQLASFSFDAWIGDLLKTLSSRGTLVICEDNDKFDLTRICQLIQEHSVSLIELTPSYILMLMEFAFERGFDLSCLEIVIIGGESCTTKEYSLLSDFAKKFDFRLVNGYGVSEACIETIVYDGDPVTGAAVPIGRPLKGMTVWVSEKGELFIGGKGIGSGYLNNEELTKEKFVEISGQGVLYRTGDLVKYNDSGDLICFGREDDQVEINGRRVELLEIENTLETINGVNKAKVISYENQNGKTAITAFYLSENSVAPQKIEEELKLKLPEYLLPHKLIMMQEFPINSNGKIDKKQLEKE